LECCSFVSSNTFKNALEGFKKACLACEQLESAEFGGFSVEDFPNLYAYVTFKTETKAEEIMDEYLEAMECRFCKDTWNSWFSCCCAFSFPVKFT